MRFSPHICSNIRFAYLQQYAKIMLRNQCNYVKHPATGEPEKDMQMKNELFEEEDSLPEENKKRGFAFYLKKVFKYLFITMMVMAWAAVLLVIFLRRDHAIVKTPVLSAQARSVYEQDPEHFEFYRVYPAVFRSEEGACQLKNCVYAATAGEYEIGLRIAWTQLRYCEQCGRLYTPDQLESQKKYDEEDDPHSCIALGHELVRASETGRTLSYKVFDSKGREYETTNLVTRTKDINLGFFAIKYEFIRLAFGGLYFDLDANIINRESSVDLTGEMTSEDGASDEEDRGMRWYFVIYDAETDDRLFETCIYDNDTVLEDEAYELPDSDYLS